MTLCRRLTLELLLRLADSDSMLATAATNGAVVIWNLQREGFKHVQGG